MSAPLRMRYLGLLGILSEASPHVPDDIREMIQDAFIDAENDPQFSLRYRRILNRLEIEPVDERGAA